MRAFCLVVFFIGRQPEAFLDPCFGPHGELPMTRRLKPHTWAVIATAVGLGSGSVFGGGTIYDGPLVGMDDLIKRIGQENVPTGAGVVVGQVEVPISGNYAPNPNTNEFEGKTFTLMSGASGNSGHARNVGRNFYGLDTSVAPGIIDIFVWDVNHWVASGYILYNGPSGTPPLLPPEGLKIFNNSWVGTIGNNTSDNILLRRADFSIARDDLLMMNGVNNEGNPNRQLMSHSFNGLAVGVMDGEHQSGSTLGGIDTPGRLKPDIVAPGNATSFSTPVVGAAAAMMIETARTVPSGGINPNAERSVVIKSILLAGAAKTDDHGAVWTNNPETSGPDRGTTTQPIDAIIGAGNVNVNFAHMIMTGGEQDGADTPPDAVNAQFAGWDLAAVGLDDGSRYWRFDVAELADAVSMLVTWHRDVDIGFGNSDWSIADFDLILWRVDEKGDLTTLVGDPGLPFFAGGNVVSESSIDNIEHLYITGLEPGEYTLELRRIGVSGGFTNWEAAVAWRLPEPRAILGDIDGDGTVGLSDLLILLADWGPCDDCDDCPSDLDDDCTVGLSDLLILLANWG